MINIDPEFARECFTYDPVNGILFWKERPKHHFKRHKDWLIVNGRFAGRATGQRTFDSKGHKRAVYVRLFYKGKSRHIPVHRVAFNIMGIIIPDGMEVDHKDTDRFNNRWDNLRLATRAQNGANQKVHANRKHKHLPKGVSLKRKKFRAQIGYGGTQLNLGTFTTPEEAHAAYCAKAVELYGEFARGN